VSICSGFAELVGAVAILIIVVNALRIMVGAVKPGEVFRSVALTLGVVMIAITLFETLLHLWEELAFLEKMGLAEFKASERRHVCGLIAVPRSSCRYQSRRDDSQMQERLLELAQEHPRFGYRRLHLYLHREMGVNHKRVQRVYRELGLNVNRTRRRHVTGAGERFRVPGVRDNFTRQARVPEAATSFPSHRVMRELERVMAAHGKPHAIRSDNGPDLPPKSVQVIL